MEETAAAARRGDVSSRGVESGDGQTSGLRAQQEGPEGGVWQYEKINRIGEGTYGVVYRAKDKRTGEIVALKKVRMDRERDGMPVTALRELRILQMCEHPNIVQLKCVVTGNQADSIFLVFEYCEHDMARLMDLKRAPFTEAEVKCLVRQLLHAVVFLHTHSIMHRDLKLSNLLFTNTGALKLCDFGLARHFQPVDDGSYTPKVVTLWYRAPELLLGSSNYSYPVDIWAVGCILGELLSHKPMFPGKTDAEMLERHAKMLGAANEKIWPGCSSLPNGPLLSGLAHHRYNYTKQAFPQLPAEGHELLNSMLTYDPRKRITAKEALEHPYWAVPPIPKPASAMPTFPTAHDLPEAGARGMSGASAGGAAALKRKVSVSAGGDRLGNRFGAIFGGAGNNGGFRSGPSSSGSELSTNLVKKPKLH